MRVVLIGPNGQLGSDIKQTWPAEDLVGLTHAQIEVADRASVIAAIADLKPALVVNTSAFHNVDLCESELDRAFAVNTIGAAHLADACREQSAALMHISTDYVFPGDASEPYDEADCTGPRTVYGLSKAAGEQMIRNRLPEHYIVRTSGLYGVAGASGKGGNFVERMLQLARDGKDIKVVDDQVLSPTFTADLAQKLLEIAGAGRYGTYHVTSGESCSWYEFARTIFEKTRTKVRLEPTTTANFASPAVRPAYSVLANNALAAAGIERARPWRDALTEYLGRKQYL
jgi:dTDP-4-dehydrorhamnose reductase